MRRGVDAARESRKHSYSSLGKASRHTGRAFNAAASRFARPHNCYGKRIVCLELSTIEKERRQV